MSSKNERLDITMRILGARELEREAEKGKKGIESVGKAASRTGTHRPQHIHLHVGGREIGEAVLQAGEDSAALR